MSDVISIHEVDRKSIHAVAPPGKQHSIESEQCVLGGIILDNSAYQSVSPIINEQDFYGHDHKIIYRAIQSQADKGEAFDIFTLTESIQAYGGLKESDTVQYLAALANDTPSAATVTAHAKIVRKYSLERKAKVAHAIQDFVELGNICNEINDLSNGNNSSSDDLLADYVSVASLDGQQFSRTWLVEKFIEKGRVYEFFGKYKEGKTLAVIDMVANLSIGRSWAGRGTNKTMIIWVAGEAVEDVKMRIAAWRLRHGITEQMPYYIRVKPVYMTDKDFAVRLAKEITSFEKMHPDLPVLLVLDTVARCMAPGADENSIQGLGAFINNLLDIVVRPTQSTAICVHHSGHGDSDRGRGHSSFEGAVDGIIKVAMDKGSGPPVITVASGRSRSTAGDDTFSFSIETQELPGEDNFGNYIEAPVLRYLDSYSPKKSEKLGPNEGMVKTILSENDGSMLEGDLRKALREKIKAQAVLHGKQEPSYNTIKTGAKRAVESFVEKGFAIKSDDGTTISLPAGVHGVHGVHLGYIEPSVPRDEGVHGVHTPLGVYPCTPNTYTRGKTVSEENRTKGTILDNEYASKKSSAVGTSGVHQGYIKGTRLNLPVNLPPDFGTSDEGYWDALLTEGN